MLGFLSNLDIFEYLCIFLIVFFFRFFVIFEFDLEIKKNIKTELMGMLLKKYRYKSEVI